MINLDQVRTLEWKVKQAVQLIVHLRRENDTLRGRLSDTEVRLQELETMMEAFKATQNEMESGIRSALEELDNLEAAPEAPPVGPVDPLSYPPVEVVFTAPTAVLEEAQAVVEAPVPEAAVEESVASAPSFEEEFAALAAEEEAALAADVPESVELEESSSPEENGLFDEPAPPAPEERKNEQPGLGIF